jgi:hypothetical protein
MNQKQINRESWDDPAHWSGPLSAFYFSKTDTRTWVPTKYGEAWTMNIGQPRGAWWLLIIVIGLPLLMVGIIITTQELATAIRNSPRPSPVVKTKVPKPRDLHPNAVLLMQSLSDYLQRTGEFPKYQAELFMAPFPDDFEALKINQRATVPTAKLKHLAATDYPEYVRQIDYWSPFVYLRPTPSATGPAATSPSRRLIFYSKFKGYDDVMLVYDDGSDAEIKSLADAELIIRSFGYEPTTQP